MKISNTIIWLSLLIALLALVTTGVGFFWQDAGNSYTVTSLRGQSVEMYGRGLYRYDTLFAGAGARGTDAIVLLLGIPLLLFSVWLYRRGSLRGGLLLLGTLVFFLYVYASYALGAVAYNELFLLYVVLFSACLYVFILAFTAFDRQALGNSFSANMPRRSPALFMLASGVVTLAIWGGPMVAALLANQPPERLDTYTTALTVALDLATITPAAFLAVFLILRRSPLGYLIAFSLLVLEVMLLPLIVAQTISQLSVGVAYPIGQIVGPIVGFVALALLSLWVLASLLRNIKATTPNTTASAGKQTAARPIRARR